MQDETRKTLIDYVTANYQKESDFYIARKFGVSRETIRYIRRQNGLSKNQIEDTLAPRGGDDWSQAWLKDDDGSYLVNNPEITDITEYALQMVKKHRLKEAWVKTPLGKMHIVNDEVVETIDKEAAKQAYLEELRAAAPVYPKLTYPLSFDPHLLIINPADIHVGKMSANGQYDAVGDSIRGVQGVLQRAIRAFEIDRIMFIMGNDALHVDTPTSTTTKGTHLDSVGFWHENFVAARKMYVEIISSLVPVSPVDVVNCIGNHDETMGFALADAVSCWFHNSLGRRIG